MNKLTPVLIIGAGPTGLLMGCELKRRNIPFRIIEKRLERTHTSNALGIHARTLEIFDDLGVIESFLQKALKMDAIEMRIHDKKAARLSFSSIESHYPYGIILPQSETESILEAHLEEQGIQVERGISCTDIISHETHQVVLTTGASGEEEIIHSDWLIACDGAHSMVRDKVGLPFIGKNMKAHFGMADVTLDNPPTAKIPINFMSPEGTFLAFPMKNDNWRIVGDIPPNYPKEISEKTLCEMAEQRTGNLIQPSAFHWRSTFRIRSKVIKNMRHQRVFFAGDAAHVHSPAGGQGMNTGLQDAYNLAWKLAAVIRGQTAEGLLDSYHAERHPIAKKIVKETERMTTASNRHNQLKRFLFKLMIKTISHFPNIQHRVAMRMSQLAISYQGSPIINYHTNLARHAPKPGEKAVDVQLNAETRFGDLWRGPDYTLLIFSGEHPSDQAQKEIKAFVSWCENQLGQAVRVALISTQYIEGVKQTADDNAAAHQRYHITEPTVYLLRPDKHIAYCAKGLDRERVSLSIL